MPSWSPYTGELTLSPRLEQARLPQIISCAQGGQIYRHYFGQIADSTLERWPEIPWMLIGGRKVVDTQAFLATARCRAAAKQEKPAA
jgi:hypothetical protein